MAYTLEFRDKEGGYTEVPLQDGTSARLRQQFEGPNRELMYDDLTLELWDGDGAWGRLFTQANLAPADVYPALYGFLVKRDGEPYWEGDLEYGSVDVDAEKSRVTVRVLDALKRCARKSAEALKRDYSALAIIDGPKQSTVLTVNSVLDASGYPIVAGDEVTLGHYKPTWNSGQKLFQQTLVVASVDTAPAWVSGPYRAGSVVTYSGNRYRCITDHSGQLPTNPTYWTLITGHILTFKRKMQAHYQPADVIFLKDPWMRGLTASALVGLLLDLVPGFGEGFRTVNYVATAGDDVVDVAEFAGLHVGQALEKLAYWVNAQCYSRLGTVYFVGREATQDPGPLKDITALLASGAVRPADSSRYDLVVVKGRDKRYARRGLSPFGGKKLELDLPFSKDHTRLQAVCDRLWTYWSPQRQGIPKAVVADDSTAWQLKQRVTASSVEYFVTGVAIPLNDGADVELELLAKTGTAVPVSATDVDTEAEDEFDPPEPLNFAMTKDYSTAFATLFPSDRYPRVVVRRETIGDIDGEPIYANIPYRLYELHWAYPYDEVLSRVYRFEVTIWPDGKDRDKPEVRLAVPPEIQSDGLYYAKRYMKAGKVWWADVLARYDNLKEGIPSDSDSSVNETLADGSDVAPGVPVLGEMTSYELDKAGTKRVECDLTVPLTITSGTDEVEVKVTDAEGPVYQRQPATGTSASVYFKRRFDRATVLTVDVRAKRGSAWSAWDSAASVPAWSTLTTYAVGDRATYLSVIYIAIAPGSGKSPPMYPAYWRVYCTISAGSTTGTAPTSTPPTPTLVTSHVGTKKTRLKIQLSGSAAEMKSISHLELYTAQRPVSNTPAPDSSTLWDTLPELSVEHYTKRGKSAFWIEVEHRDINSDGSLDRPAIAMRAVGNQSDTPSGWLYFDTLFEGWIQMLVDPLAAGDNYTVRFSVAASGGSGLGRQWKWSFGDGSGTAWEADAAGYYVDKTYAVRPEPMAVQVTLQAKDSLDNRFEATLDIGIGGYASNDTQLRKPSTVTSEVNAHSGATTWSNPTNVASVSDLDYASVVLAANAFSRDLKCVAYGLSAAADPPPGDGLPVSGVIKGLALAVTIECTIASKVKWDKVQLIYNGVSLGPPKVVTTLLASGKVTVTFGGFGNKWDADLTVAKLRSATFGVLLAFQNSDAFAQTVKVYDVKARAWADNGT